MRKKETSEKRGRRKKREREGVEEGLRLPLLGFVLPCLFSGMGTFGILFFFFSSFLKKKEEKEEGGLPFG